MLSNKQFDIIYLFEGEISLYSVKIYPSVWFVSVKEKRLEVVSPYQTNNNAVLFAF